MKVFMVTTAKKVSKNNVQSRVVGFVTAFGWEKPEDKAVRKYPHLGNFAIHEQPRRR